MAGRATGQTQTAQVATGRDLAGERRTAAAAASAGGVEPAPKAWIDRAYRIGRVGVFAIPILAVLAAFGAPEHAFSLNPEVYANFAANRWSSPMTIATTAGTGAFAIISIISLALLLAGTRARWVALAGLVAGVAGAVMMLIEVGTVVIRAQGIARPVIDGRLDRAAITAASNGTHAAIMVFGGAALLTLGWILLGIAIMCTYGLNKGDGTLLIVAAPMMFLGGFFLHTLPTMGAFLLGAAGLGLILTSGRIASYGAGPVRPARVPAPPMSAFARFTDDDLDALYRGGEAPAAYAAPVTYEAVTATDPAHSGIGRARGTSAGYEVHRSEAGTPEVWPLAGPGHTAGGLPAVPPPVETPKPAKKVFSFASWSPFRGGDKQSDATTPAEASLVNGSAGNGDGLKTADAKAAASVLGPDADRSQAAPPNGNPSQDAKPTGEGPDGIDTSTGKPAKRKRFSTSSSVVASPDEPKTSANRPTITSPTRADKAGNAANPGSGGTTNNAGKRPEPPAAGTGSANENGASAQRD